MQQCSVWRGKLWTGINGKMIELRLRVGQNSNSCCGRDFDHLIKVTNMRG